MHGHAAEKSLRTRSFCPATVRDRKLLVICEPRHLAWFPSGDRAGRIVQWVGADSSEQVIRHLASISAQAFVEPPISFGTGEPEWVIFDSALSLDNARDRREVLEVELAAGNYRLFAQYFETPQMMLNVFDVRAVSI